MFFSLGKFPVIILVITLLISSAVFGTGAGDPVPDQSSAIELVDFFGRTIQLDKQADTIVSLAPGITETVFALGYGEKLVGRTSYCDYPEAAASVADIGSLNEPNIEAIIAASPDLVIGSTHFTRETLASLENAGLKVAVFMGQERLEGVYDGVIRPVSAVLGDSEAGESLIESMKAVSAEAIDKVGNATYRPKVYYVVGFGEGGEWTAGGDTFIGQMIDLAGGDNIAGDVSGWAFSTEALIDRDPDIILVPAWAQEIFVSTEPYSNLRAVKSGMVVVIDENAIVRQGPRQAEGFSDLVDAVDTAR